MSITYEFSTNESLLKQYYVLRKECFIRELGISDFDGLENIYDNNGKILIVRDGDQCIGGIRITGCSLASQNILPLEQKGFSIVTMLQSLSMPLAPYCQAERLVLKNGFRNKDIFAGMCKAVIEKCSQLGYHYVFNVSCITRAKLYKRIHSILGYQYGIYNEVKIPVESEFSHLEHILSITYIPKFAEEEMEDMEVMNHRQVASA